MKARDLLRTLTMDRTMYLTIGGVTGIVSAIQREDGSGRRFNVTLRTKDGDRVVYLQVED